MNIYILRDGKEDGPFTEEATQTLLKQGSVLIGDLAWRPGMPSWVPLHAVLYPGPPTSDDQRPPPPPESVSATPVVAPAETHQHEPATAKQKALLNYLGIHFSSSLSKDQAAALVNDAMENSKHAARLAQWNDDRLRLHPELFAAELQAKKADRARHYFEICQLEGAEYFTKVTKAHCQVLVSHLDVAHPNWDANESIAARSYFFPAIAEKFPQLVQKEWVGKLHYPSAAKVAPEVARRAPAPLPVKKSSSFAGALMRGLFFGALIVGVLWFAWKTLRPPGGSEAGKMSAASKSAAAGKPGDTKAPTGTPAPSSPDAAPPGTTPAATADSTAGDALAAAAGTMNPASAGPDGASSAMSPMSGVPLFDDKGAPPAPPSTSLVPEAPPVKTTVLLTKPFDAALTYGTITLPPGTALRLISHDGGTVKAMYLNKVLNVPAASTDIDAPPATPPAAPAP